MPTPKKKGQTRSDRQAKVLGDISAHRVDRQKRLLMRNHDPIGYQKSLVKNRILEMKEDLPHKYGWRWYRWASAFYESRNKVNLLCSGNQVSKSSTLIRKNIEWAGNKKIWREIWPDQNGKENRPRQFWYFYPSMEVATIEFEKKWIPEFMPRGDMKHHDTYGWDAEYSGSEVAAIHFRSGVTIYFKTYSQRQINLQTASCHMISADEEMPESYVDETMSRLAATEGYFNMVFTATQGFPLWYRAMECIGKPEETFKTAFKLCVSLYDCQTYADGTPGFWSLERIKEREAKCTSVQEVQKRIHGRFVRDEGRKYSTFDPSKLVMQPEKIPSDWKIYAGVDIGSGGGKGRSMGAVVFVATSPDFVRGRVIRSWRGDHRETTAADILEEYRKLKQGLVVTQACYDYGSREFAMIASRSGEPFIAADKSRDMGEQTLNTLFQAGALMIDDAYENGKLVTELMSLPSGDKVKGYVDDIADATRYCVNLIPWDFARIAPQIRGPHAEEREEVMPTHMTAEQYNAWEISQRRGVFKEKPKSNWDEYYTDIDEWNEAYGS